MIEKEAVATSSNVTEQMARAAGAVNKVETYENQLLSFTAVSHCK